MIISKFVYDNGIETYYSCKSILIHEYLVNRGYNSSLQMECIINLAFLPAIQINENIIYEASYENQYLGYSNYNILYGIQNSIIEYKCEKQGIKEICDQISIGEPVIVSGTQYHLPYSDYYHKTNYIDNYGSGIYGICNHWIMVLGYTDDSFYIRDPSYQYVGYISKQDFESFWKGNSQFDSLKLIVKEYSLLVMDES